jgi:streptogramin lyase
MAQRLSMAAFSAFIALLAGGCALHGAATPGPSAAQPQATRPDVVQRGGGNAWVKFKTKSLGLVGAGIIAGPDGAMWFLDETEASLARLTVDGSFSEFSLGSAAKGDTVALTVGSDGKFYIVDESANIVRATTGGTIESFNIPSGDNTDIGTDALGPDGNVWFPETAHLGTITPSGVITEYAYPKSFTVPNQYGTITTGSDGNLWFGETADNAIVKFNMTTHAFTEYVAPSLCQPAGLQKARDGNIWFACLSAAIRQVGRITKAGVITLFPGGANLASQFTMQISTVAKDGQPWFDGSGDDDVFRINIPSGTVSTFSPPFQSGERPDSIAIGPDGNLWVPTVGLHNVYVKVAHPMTLAPKSMSFPSTGQMQDVVVMESGTTAWTAATNNAAVAKVAQGSPSDTFVVTSTGVGNCRVTVADGIGNSAILDVSVH